MKRFWLFSVMMLTLPLAGLTQTTPPSATSPSTTPPAAATPSPAAVPQVAPATSGGQGAGPSATSGQPVVAAKPSDAAPTYAGPMDPTRYVIGPEDSLQITVWKEQTLSGAVPVRPDGMISLVLIGDMPAAGQTPMALANDIATRLKKYIQDPVVTVSVLGVNSQRIFMVGEVGHVGPIMLTPGMTPLQAIVSAGGLGQFANQKKIYILRNVGGKQQKIPFNYKAAVKGTDEGVPLLPGDTIIVP